MSEDSEYVTQKRIQIITCCNHCKDCWRLPHDGYECRQLGVYINEGAVHHTFLKGCPLEVKK